jgi:hypothetical protein
MRVRHLLVALAGCVLLWLAAPQVASAASAPSTQATPQQTAPQASPAHKKTAGHNCPLGTVLVQSNPVAPIVNAITGDKTDQGCDAVSVAGRAALSAAGSAAKGLAGDVMDQVASWMVGAAQTVGSWVAKAMASTTTPELTSAWYQSEFGYLAMFGAALAGIVALLGLVSAALRQDPYALGEIFYGIFRAGVITAIAISLTLLALKVADGISGDVLHYMPKGLFQTLSSAWGKSGWGGLGSSALAFLLALVEVLIGVLVWVELLFRDAAIYVAVLFLPVTLAVAIWPRLSGMQAKLVRVLGVFIALKPVMLIVLMTGGNLLAGGISFYGGLGPSVGTIIAGLIVLAMAGFAPWALMHLLGMDVGAMGVGGRGRTGRTGGVAGASDGGALGGDLVAGPIGGVTARRSSVSSSEPTGGPQGSSRPSGRTPSQSGAISANGAGSRRLPVPGAVAAAAGWLPAVAAAGQNLAGHGAARVHTAGGHGGYPPSGAPWQPFTSSQSDGRGATPTIGEPVGPPASPPPARPADPRGPIVGGAEPSPGADAGRTTPGPESEKRNDQT